MEKGYIVSGEGIFKFSFLPKRFQIVYKSYKEAQNSIKELSKAVEQSPLYFNVHTVKVYPNGYWEKIHEKVDNMKLTQEDIKKYGTVEEKEFIKENSWRHPADDFLGTPVANKAKEMFKSEIVQKELKEWCDNNDEENVFYKGFLIGFTLGGAK